MAPRERSALVDFKTGDCYSVTREPDGRFLVKHFPTWEPKTKPCCQVRVTRKPGEDEIQALRRADAAIERKHEAKDAART